MHGVLIAGPWHPGAGRHERTRHSAVGAGGRVHSVPEGGLAHCEALIVVFRIAAVLARWSSSYAAAWQLLLLMLLWLLRMMLMLLLLHLHGAGGFLPAVLAVGEEVVRRRRHV